ncbi:uncharacterized protein LACBIDRAFT_315291 [Laccaria bicolor S238N-H82]|uniref:Predicted protein n=1 Tax=Laccaria bicolor (strain S238N-H82 / ATCC MYA-4686) TaxID=486041 RepID=B0E094_LACBS|nr:uncharacterized protein LACBIDRAFT_315291 [Laccaria bicolor S238N-H82]EDQ99783.1 predicted protein [Laccaria bicolor S238N-H82]|eukprot:XP_001889619.1 predicted protein [Laccaria bicolor S238N-H82]
MDTWQCLQFLIPVPTSSDKLYHVKVLNGTHSPPSRSRFRITLRLRHGDARSAHKLCGCKTTCYVAAAMLLVYDCSLTLGMEIEFMWSSPWGFMKVLYMLQRYLPFCDSIFFCLTHQLAINIDPYGCHIVETIRGGLMVFGMILSEVILSLRAWAVWKRDLRLGVSLISLITLTTMAEIYVTRIFLRDLQFSTKPYPEFVGCFLTSANHIVYLDWVVLMIYEAVILVLMIIPGIASYRRGGNVDLYHVIYRDGIIMYIYLFALSIVNVVFMCALSTNYFAVISNVERVLHSLLTSRVVLHIRECIKRQQPSYTDGLTDLHVDLDASKPENRFRKRWRA